MACTQHKQLICFPRVRVCKKWFRYFNDHKDFKNDGNLHLFSLMALYSYANFRSNNRHIGDEWYREAPGQWICKLSALPRILRSHSKEEAALLLERLREDGFLDFEMLDEESGLLRYTIPNWRDHCAHLEYNYYSYTGSGFFFFPLSVGRHLIAHSRKHGTPLFSELDAIMDLWLHTVLNDEHVVGSEYMPIVYYANMGGKPLLSYAYLAKRWGWSKSRVGRFILRAEEAGIISRISFSSSRGSIISVNHYREMIFGENTEQIQLKRIGEILKITAAVEENSDSPNIDLSIQSRVPQRSTMWESENSLRIQGFRRNSSSFFARPVPLIFYSSLDCGEILREEDYLRGPPNRTKFKRGDRDNERKRK